MKRWAALTVLIYLLALLALTVPVVALGFGPQGDQRRWFDLPLELMRHGYYWLWVGIMVGGQALLLVLPVNLRRQRPTARRPLFVPVVTATFFLGNLTAAGLFCILCVVSEDRAFNLLELIGGVVSGNFKWDPAAQAMLQTAGINSNNQWLIFFSGSLTLIAAFWVMWAVIFFRRLSRPEEKLMDRITEWLLRGSILELLVAVPSHVIVRRRDDCCAPGGTFWGITMGLSVMLMCFGPGVFFLFVERFRRLRPPERIPQDAVAEKSR